MSEDLLTLDAIEERVVKARLLMMRNNKPRAAESLGVNLKTLYNLIHRWSKTSTYDPEFWKSAIRSQRPRVTT